MYTLICLSYTLFAFSPRKSPLVYFDSQSEHWHHESLLPYALWPSNLGPHMAIIEPNNYVVANGTCEVNILALQFKQFAESLSWVVYILAGAALMYRRHLMYSVWKHIKDWTFVSLPSITYEGVCSCSYFCMLYPFPTYIFFHPTLLKWTWVLPNTEPQAGSD